VEVLKRWKSERRHFLIKISVFAFFFYMFLPISIGLFPDFMSTPRLGWVSWAWIYSFAQIGVTWLLGWIYWVKAKELDKLLVEMQREAGAAE